MDFGEILSKAWKIIWKNKILWLFGVLASVGAASSSGGGSSGSGGSAISSSGQSGNWNGPDFLAPSTQRALQDFFQTLKDVPAGVWVGIALGVIVVGFIFSILFMMLNTLGTTGVIRGTSLADQAGPDAKPLSLGEIFKALKPSYWKVFLLNLGLRVGGVVVWLMIAIPIILFAVMTCFLGLFLLIPIGWFIDVMIIFTTIAVVEEGKGIFEGIGRAWQMVTKNLGHVLIMFLILWVGQLVLGVIIGLPMLIAPVPLLINLTVTGLQEFTVGLVITSILLLIALPLVTFLGGVLKAYVLSSWTLTYRRMAAENAIEPEVLSREASPD